MMGLENKVALVAGPLLESNQQLRNVRGQDRAGGSGYLAVYSASKHTVRVSHITATQPRGDHRLGQR
jgi:hypothetical protein